jgi:hypothetical protein
MARKRIAVDPSSVRLEHLPDVSPLTTVREAQQMIGTIIAQNEAGTICPCCGRSTKPYPKKITPVLAARLLTLIARYWVSKKWERIPEIPEGKEANFLSLADWDLIQVRKNAKHIEENGKYSVKPTRLAWKWAQGRVRLPSHLFFFSGKQVGASLNEFTCQEAIDNKYDYQALFSQIPAKKKKIKGEE